MNRVLVTGAGGFIGRHSIAPLRDAGFEVHAVDLGELPDVQVEQHQADLHDPEQVRSVVARIRPSHLLHFAWYVKHGEFWTSPDNARWVQSSIHLLQAFCAAGGKRVVSAGTCAEYEWGHDVCREDSTPCRPSTFYGSAKLASSVMQEGICRQHNVSQAWGRIFHLYGPFEPHGRFVPSVTRSLLSGVPARCTHGKQLRDFMHVSDIAAAFVRLLQCDGIHGNVNIASGRPVTQAEVAHLIANHIGRSQLLQLGAIPAGNEPERLIADVRRLSETGFRPRLSLSEGLAETIQWWRDSLSCSQKD